MTHHVQVVRSYKDPRNTNHTDTIRTGVEWDVNKYNTLVVRDQHGRIVKAYASHEWESVSTVGLDLKEDNKLGPATRASLALKQEGYSI